MIQTSSAVMQLFKGLYVNVAAGSRHLWPYSNDNAGSLEIVLKLLQLPLKLRFSGKCSCFEQPLSREHFPAIFQPPGNVCLLKATKYWVREFWVCFTNNPAGNKTEGKISQNLVQQSVI